MTGWEFPLHGQPPAPTNFCLHLALCLCSLHPSLIGSSAIPRIGQGTILPRGLYTYRYFPLEWNVFPVDSHTIVISPFKSAQFFCFPFTLFYFPPLYLSSMDIYIISLSPLKCKLHKVDFAHTNVQSNPWTIPIISPSLFCWPLVDGRIYPLTQCKDNAK